MARRITHKKHDEKERIIAVKIDNWEVAEIIDAWKMINNNREEFYTFENNKNAKVFARERKDGTKYLTSSSDGITENNLDELPTF